MAKPQHPSPPLARRILVIQTAFLGDIVLTTSFLANLRALAPEAEIHFLTTPAGAQLLRVNTMGIQPIAYDKRGQERGLRAFWNKARELRALQPDLVFCLHRSFRSALLTKYSGGESWGFTEAAGSFFFDHAIARAGKIYEAEKNNGLLEAWAGVSIGSLYPRLEAGAQAEQEAARLVEALGPFAAFAPGSVWATKRWPAERFGALAAALAQKRGWQAVFVGSDTTEDRAAVAEATATFQRLTGRAALNLAGKTNLGVLTAIFARAQLVVANDSAPLHMAIAAGRPVLGIFGPTTKDLGFFPLAPAGRSAVVEVEGLYCRPCGLHGHQRCPETHFRCMLELSPERALAEVEKLLCP